MLAGLKEKLLAPELVREAVAAFAEEMNRHNRETEASWKASRRELLNEPETRSQAAEILRSLVDEIRLSPLAEDGLGVELFGELGAIMALGDVRNDNRAGSGPARFSLVAGIGFEPMTFRL